jgi:hypothetical protein
MDDYWWLGMYQHGSIIISWYYCHCYYY